MRLVGPWPFDLQSPQQSARTLVGGFAATVRGEVVPGMSLAGLAVASPGTAPGIYLLLEGDDALCGFWIVFSPRYLDDGPDPGRVPPYVEPLLEAVTEEIWWDHLPIGLRRGGTWRPVIVFEWPPAVALRASVRPPGTFPDDDDDAPQGDDADDGEGSWLDPAQGSATAPMPREVTSKLEWMAVPEARSLVCAVQAELRRAQQRAEGRWSLAFPPPPEALPASGEPFEDWIRRVSSLEPRLPAEIAMGTPVALPGGRAGFPISGWLTRDLDVSPPRPGEAIAGVLAPRDVQSQLVSQVALASALTLAVIFSVLALSWGVYFASLPEVESRPSLPLSKPQPAMSVCSSDHAGFVEELRCQVDRMARGMPVALDGCVTANGFAPPFDLLPAWCGLRDRDVDERWFQPPGTREAWSYADVAAAQACHQVLGRPASHARGNLAEPARFLAEDDKMVRALHELVGQLDAACDDLRPRIESRVSGAVLGTHVGGATAEGQALADLVFSRASTGMGQTARTCLDAGRRDGPTGALGLDALCPGERRPDSWRAREVAQLLRLDPGEDVIPSYESARFLGERPDSPLWKCHHGLSRGSELPPLEGRWDVTIDLPSRYGRGAIGSQLVLDAAVLATREDGALAAGDCWPVLEGMLASYTPVHPLVQVPEADGWPSAEQQVCGQICAVHHHLAASQTATDWVTHGADLASCIDPDPPPTGSRADLADLGLDRLRLPWNYAGQDEWVSPSVAQACAFGLVSQEIVANVLPESMPAPLWAGDLVRGIAGAQDGGAARSAVALSGFGRSRSTTSCGSVAVQCFGTKLLAVLESESHREPHAWKDKWLREVRAIATLDDDALRDDPWCRLVQPYLREDGTLPEGQLDFPCALGVEEARRRYELAINDIAKGIAGEAP